MVPRELKGRAYSSGMRPTERQPAIIEGRATGDAGLQLFQLSVAWRARHQPHECFDR